MKMTWMMESFALAKHSRPLLNPTLVNSFIVNCRKSTSVIVDAKCRFALFRHI